MSRILWAAIAYLFLFASSGYATDSVLNAGTLSALDDATGVTAEIARARVQRVVQVLDGYQIKIYLSQKEDFIGFSYGKDCAVVLSTAALHLPEEQFLFALAHEVGHCMMAHPSALFRYTLKTDKLPQLNQQRAWVQEYDADEFSANLLRKIGVSVPHGAMLLAGTPSGLTHPDGAMRQEAIATGKRTYPELIKLDSTVAGSAMSSLNGKLVIN